MIAGVEIAIDGQKLAPEVAEKVVEVRVDDSLMLPDQLVLQIADPGLGAVDSLPLEIGKRVEVRLAAPTDEGALAKVFDGEIVALEPEFGRSGTRLVARALDKGHRLNRTRTTQTYQKQTVADIAQKVIRRAGLTPKADDLGSGDLPFVQQSNETDWEFLWRLARRVDGEVVVEGDTVRFRAAGGPKGQALKLAWPETLHSFRPRVSGMRQVDEVEVRAHDAASGKAIVGRAKLPAPDSRAGIKPGTAGGALGGGSVAVIDRPVSSQKEADALAKSVAAALANGFLEGEGVAQGNPKLRAGAVVEIAGVGTRFGGTYTLTSTSHVFRGGHGYETRFQITGREPRGVLGPLAGGAAKTAGAAAGPAGGLGSGLVVGHVTNADDPDKLGRVRVKYPALSDDAEGWWARLASPGAGQERGLLWLPLVGDEVLVGFEAGDPLRPYVLGALWNGQAKPGQKLVQTDGTFEVASDKKIEIRAKDVISLRSDKDLQIETDGKIVQKANGDVSVEGQSVSVKAQGSLTVEASGTLTIKGASVKIEASGDVAVSGSMIRLN